MESLVYKLHEKMYFRFKNVFLRDFFLLHQYEKMDGIRFVLGRPQMLLLTSLYNNYSSDGNEVSFGPVDFRVLCIKPSRMILTHERCLNNGACYHLVSVLAIRGKHFDHVSIIGSLLTVFVQLQDMHLCLLPSWFKFF